MNAEIIKEPLKGVKILKLNKFIDSRGTFLKTYNKNFFNSQNFDFLPEEQYITSSRKNVLRGMHFQTKYSAHKKLVTCIKGSVLDVVVDIRKDSPNFNKPFGIEISNDNSLALLIDEGFAHGFLSLDDESLMIYMTSTVYCPENDKGILWNSIDFHWPVKDPLISERDKKHPSIINY